MIYFAIILTILILVEVIFRILYKKKYGRNYHVSIQLPWKKNYVATHPFLTFCYKKNSVINVNQKIPYKLHPNVYSSFKEPIQINNMGHFGKDFSTIKNDTIRVACLGNSNIANNISDGVNDYSVPTLLEKCLNKNGKFEVCNFNIGGWVSVDVLIDFVLNVVRTKPDYVILCHGFTDLYLYLLDNFEPDYSHGRRNLGNKIWKIKLAYLFPKIRLFHFYEFLRDKFLGTGNIRDDVIGLVRMGKVNNNNNYDNLFVEKDILKNIFILCSYYKIKLIACSYPFYNYDHSKISNKIEEGIDIENSNMKELAKEFGFPFCDLQNILPKEDKYFLDWVHLTPDGMGILTKEIKKELDNYMEE